jgi:hypothetical protein
MCSYYRVLVAPSDSFSGIVAQLSGSASADGTRTGTDHGHKDCAGAGAGAELRAAYGCLRTSPTSMRSALVVVEEGSEVGVPAAMAKDGSNGKSDTDGASGGGSSSRLATWAVEMDAHVSCESGSEREEEGGKEKRKIERRARQSEVCRLLSLPGPGRLTSHYCYCGSACSRTR